ncbi:MAG: hypothetical protein DRP64_20185 [Verrucomicrobia bacterium]|nr:MAG: hypothetical protein DRP64_20185 [Verrucomicrobiota bacterium]
MKRLSICILLLLVAHPVYGGDVVEESYERLLKVERFAFGGTGFAGSISQGELDFRVLLKNKKSSERFRGLYDHGNIQAKCYALVAFSQLDKALLDELSEELSKIGGEVTTMEGCIVAATPVPDEVERIGNGAYSIFFGDEYLKRISEQDQE